MAKAVTIRVDEKTKQEAENLLDEIGLNMTAYLNFSLKALVREKKVPFELTSNDAQNIAYIEKLERSIIQADHGEIVSYTREEMRAMEKTIQTGI